MLHSFIQLSILFIFIRSTWCEEKKNTELLAIGGIKDNKYNPTIHKKSVERDAKSTHSRQKTHRKRELSPKTRAITAHKSRPSVCVRRYVPFF